MLYFRPILNRTYSAEIPVLPQNLLSQGKRNLRLQRIIKQCRTLVYAFQGIVGHTDPQSCKGYYTTLQADLQQFFEKMGGFACRIFWQFR